MEHNVQRNLGSSLPPEAMFSYDGTPRVPNDALLQAIEETEQIIREYELGIRKGKTYATARELFEAMDLEDDDDDE